MNLLFPQVCGFCGKLDKNALCKNCEKKLKQKEYFTVESYEEGNYVEKAYFFEYSGFIRDAIIQYKFRDKPYLYESFVNFIIKNKKFVDFLKSYDIIIPVPISKKRYKERGYNQSLLIANKLAKIYNELQKENKLRVINNCLIKNKDTVEQSSLQEEQRENNAIGVYTLKNKQILTNKNILILDDVYTTGNTVFECSQMIKQANPNSVGVFTLAKDL